MDGVTLAAGATTGAIHPLLDVRRPMVVTLRSGRRIHLLPSRMYWVMGILWLEYTNLDTHLLAACLADAVTHAQLD